MELRPAPVGLRLCSDLRGLVFGSFDSRTQRGWVLSRSDPRGLGPSVSGPKGVSIWVLRCQDQKGVGVGPYPDPRGVGGGSMSGPKGVGVWVLRCPTQGIWGWVLPFRTQVGLGVGSCPDPRAMRVGQVGTQGG
jgi:hypothetical protein